MDKETQKYWLYKDLEDNSLNILKLQELELEEMLLQLIITGYNLGFERCNDLWYNVDYICDRCGELLKEMNNPNEILIDTLEKLSKLGSGDKLGNSNGNVIAQKGLAKYYEALNNPDTIEDGYGNSWNKKCSSCNNDTMVILKPGKVECSTCG